MKIEKKLQFLGLEEHIYGWNLCGGTVVWRGKHIIVYLVCNHCKYLISCYSPCSHVLILIFSFFFSRPLEEHCIVKRFCNKKKKKKKKNVNVKPLDLSIMHFVCRLQNSRKIGKIGIFF